MNPTTWLLAHQGGWDEALMVAGPLVVIGLLLRVANKRAAERLEALGQDPTLVDQD